MIGIFSIKSESKKTRHVQNLAISKKSIIFVLSSWNFIKVSNSWGSYFDQVSWGQDNKIKEIYDPKLGARISKSIFWVHLDPFWFILILYDIKGGENMGIERNLRFLRTQRNITIFSDFFLKSDFFWNRIFSLIRFFLKFSVFLRNFRLRPKK